MEQVLSGLHWNILLIYLDDAIVISPDFTSHVSWPWEDFDHLWAAGLKLKLSKCALLQPEFMYLSHVVSHEEVATTPEKVQAVKE